MKVKRKNDMEEKKSLVSSGLLWPGIANNVS